MRNIAAKYAFVLWMLSASVSGFAIEAYADEPSAQAVGVAKEILAESHAEERVKQVMNGLFKSYMDSFTKDNPDRGKEVAEVMNDVLLPELLKTTPLMLDETAKIYARNFSVDELKQLLDFYHSPLGVKLIERQPEIMKETMELGLSVGQSVAASVRGKLLAELEKRGLKKPQGI